MTIDLAKWTQISWMDRLERVPGDYGAPQEMSGYIPPHLDDSIYEQEGKLEW